MRRATTFFFFAIAACAAIAESPQSYVTAFAEKAIFKHATISITVLDLEDDRIIASLNPEKALTPASSLKLVTTLSAVDLLGADYIFETLLAYDGQLLDDGTLEGDLYIIGSGDPTLGSPKMAGCRPFRHLLNDWVSACRKAGITCIDGAVIADESVFNSFPVSPSWQWNDLGNYYACGAWGLNVHENSYDIYFQQVEQIGAASRIVSKSPYVPGLEVINEVTIAEKGSGDNAYIFGGPYDYTKRIVGTIPAGKERFRIKGAIPDPPLFLAYHLAGALDRAGIQHQGHRSIFLPQKRAKKAVIIDRIESPPLSAIARKANVESNNLYCESLLKTIGHVKRGEGSGESGKTAIRRHLKRKGISTSALHMEDGSGLSARNAVSSLFLARFLKHSFSDNGEAMLTYLPRAGQGTLRSFMSGRAAQSKVWAKSGSMDRVLSYSGIMHGKSGRWYAFSIIVNGHSDKNKDIRPHIGNLVHQIWRRISH